MSETVYRIPDAVIEDTHAYRREVEKFLAGEISPVAYRAIRVPVGIYEQRENDTYMVRVRGAAGVFLPHQVQRIADLSEQYGNGIVHVTTRQDLQIHRVLVEHTPDVLEKLLEVGLSSRGGGGNTVRNISACQRAGVCADEVFDVAPYAIALTEYLLIERGNFNLPRKFKAAFSGCSKDCGLASVADLGFFAHERDGIRGFAVYAGGGMGLHSALGVLIEEFIPAEAIFETAEAVKRLFDKYGDRTNRHKARLRFVVERVGEDEFRRLYREELARVRSEGIAVPGIRMPEPAPSPPGTSSSDEPIGASYQSWRSSNVLPQKQDGLFTVRIPLPLGDIPADDLRALAHLAQDTGDGTLRTTQEQDLQLRSVSADALPGLYQLLSRINGPFVDAQPVRCVACAGASTCKLGLCLSRGLAAAIEAELADVDLQFDSPIRISGCPNSCGHHPIAAIGLSGGAVRSDGRLAPVYSIYADGRLSEGGSRLSRLIGKVPAKAVPGMFKEFFTDAVHNRLPGETAEDLIERWGASRLHELAQKYVRVPSYDEAPEYYRDFGSDEEFSLAGRGPGECGAGVMDVIALDIDAARNALDENRLYDAVVASARALLVTKGLEPKKDREVFAAFSEHLIAPGWVSASTQSVLDAALDLKLGDRDTLADLMDDIRALLDRVEVLFRSLDSNLEFRVAPVHEPVDEPASQEASHELDLRGVACPMNFVRAKISLEQIEVGEVLDILLDEGEPARNVPASFADQGQEVLSVADEGGHFRVRVRRTE